MKKSLATLLATVTLSFGIHAAEVIRIDTPELDSTVQKVYSVYCPFCYKYEKAVTPNMIKHLPTGTTFQAICLESKGELGIEACQVLAATATIGEMQYKKAKLAMYSAVHDKKLASVKGKTAVEGTLRDIGLKAAGVSKEAFETALNTPQAQEKLAYDRTIAKTIALERGIPAIVINGNKLVNTATVGSLKDLDDTIAANL
ncbi:MULTISPECIES: thioredoxin domain-containing protein [Ferrimonas]|uniref:thioredoxin domain-containing protein n=1 Tax=Ferrimonas TaxID=44011 RepID=UPI00041315BE|nr:MULTISPECIES: thioredoxin domain-containing protein [Ferrimonas]USD35956.1 thioredoxin domain-containing protein [Ferrimonas sp. SCSIO 43195]